MTVNFVNGLANLKEGYSFDEEKLRGTRVFAKLMLKEGMKFDNVESREDFILSEAKEHIRAEMFILNEKRVPVIVRKFYVNINVDAEIKKSADLRMYFVELEHPKLNMNEVEEVDF